MIGLTPCPVEDMDTILKLSLCLDILQSAENMGKIQYMFIAQLVFFQKAAALPYFTTSSICYRNDYQF